jgi:hypothetical protein
MQAIRICWARAHRIASSWLNAPSRSLIIQISSTVNNFAQKIALAYMTGMLSNEPSHTGAAESDMVKVSSVWKGFANEFVLILIKDNHK